MGGTHKGGLKTAAANKQRYGLNFYKQIGRAGGKKSRGGGFGSDKIGPDGLTGKERAAVAGKIGGTTSRKPPAYVDYDQLTSPKKPFLHRAFRV